MAAAEVDAPCGADGGTPVALWIDFWAETEENQPCMEWINHSLNRPPKAILQKTCEGANNKLGHSYKSVQF